MPGDMRQGRFVGEELDRGRDRGGVDYGPCGVYSERMLRREASFGVSMQEGQLPGEFRRGSEPVTYHVYVIDQVLLSCANEVRTTWHYFMLP